MSDLPFKDMSLWTKVRATKDITTKNRIMKAGDTGVISRMWAYMVEVRPDGKKLNVEVMREDYLEIIKN